MNARNSIEDNTSILSDTETEWLFYHSEFEEHIDKIREDCPGIKNYVCLDNSKGYGQVLEDWTASVSGTAPDLPHDPNATALLLSSGGTTGKPKG